MKAGEKYLVTFANGRDEWRFVGEYIGHNYLGEHQFSLRPHAGTQSIPRRSLIAVEARSDLPICVPAVKMRRARETAR